MLLECRIRDGVKGIHLTMNKMGRPSGRAFIEMEHEEDVNKAREKHRQYLGQRYVEGLSSPKATVTVGESGVRVLRKIYQASYVFSSLCFAVYEVTERDAEAIIQKATEAQVDDGVVRLRGLPFASTEADIAQFFSGSRRYNLLLCLPLFIDRLQGSFIWLLFRILHPTTHLVFEFGNVNDVTLSSYAWLFYLTLEFFIDYVVLPVCCNGDINCRK